MFLPGLTRSVSVYLYESIMESDCGIIIWKALRHSLHFFFIVQAMRSHENNEAQVCYFIIQLLLLKPNDFRNRVNDFVKENAPEHWLQSDWHNKHMNYYKVKNTSVHLKKGGRGMLRILSCMDFVFHFPEIPREALLRGPCRPGQPPHAAPASVSTHLLWQRVPALPACLWHRHSPLFGASSCCQVPGDAPWSSGRLVQVPW